MPFPVETFVAELETENDMLSTAEVARLKTGISRAPAC